MMMTKSTNADDPEMVALSALTWVLSDEARAGRLLAVTGLTPEGLRAGVGRRDVLGAVLAFLESYEPDLLAGAAAMNVRPEDLVDAGRALG
jgi:hypothetical protein